MISSLASFLRRFPLCWIEAALSKTAEVLPKTQTLLWLEAYKQTAESGGYTVVFLSEPTERLLVNLEEKFNLALRGQVSVDANLLQRALSFFRAFSDYLKSPLLLPPPFFGVGKDSVSLESLWAWAGYPLSPTLEDFEKALHQMDTAILPEASRDSFRSLGLSSFWQSLCKDSLPSWSSMQERRFSALLLDLEDASRVVTPSFASSVVWLRSLAAFQSRFLEKKNAAPQGTPLLTLLSFGELLDLSQATQILLDACDLPLKRPPSGPVVEIASETSYSLPRILRVVDPQASPPSGDLSDDLRRFLVLLRGTIDHFLRPDVSEGGEGP